MSISRHNSSAGPGGRITAAVYASRPERVVARLSVFDCKSEGWFAPWLPGPVVTLALATWFLPRRGSLWVDEAITMAATHNLAETLSETSGTMGIYYVLLTPWSWVTQTAAGIRLPSVVFMAIATGVLGALVGRQHGRRVGALAGAISALLYLPSYYALEARSYGLLAMLSVVSWYALDRILADEERSWIVVYLVCATAIPLTHGLGVVQVAAQLGAVALARPGPKVVRGAVFAALLSGGVAVFLLTVGINDVAQWVPPLSRKTALEFLATPLNPNYAPALLLAVVACLGVRDALQGSTDTPADRFRRLCLLFWGSGAMLMILGLSLFRPAQIPRYSISASFGLAGLLALGVRRLDARYPFAVAAIAVLVLSGTHLFTSDRGNQEPWTEVIRTVDGRVQPGDQIAFGNQPSRIGFEATWVQESGPALTVVGPSEPLGRFDRFGDTASASALTTGLDPASRLWLVDWPSVSQPSRTPAVVDDLVNTSGWVVVDRWSPGDGISLILLGKE